jgi:hypothetical protein
LISLDALAPRPSMAKPGWVAERQSSASLRSAAPAALPGFPVDIGGAGELHAAFLTESRTRTLGWSHVQEIRVASSSIDIPALPGWATLGGAAFTPRERMRSLPRLARAWTNEALALPALKRVIRVEAFSQSAKALLSAHKCGRLHHQFGAGNAPDQRTFGLYHCLFCYLS